MTNGQEVQVEDLESRDLIEYEVDGETKVGAVWKWVGSSTVGEPTQYRVWVCPGDSVKPCNEGSVDLVSFELSEEDTVVLVKKAPELGPLNMKVTPEDYK